MINSCLCPFRPNQPPAPKRPSCSNRPITLKKKSYHQCSHGKVRERAREGEGARDKASQTDKERETRKHYKCESDSAFERVRNIYYIISSLSSFLSIAILIPSSPIILALLHLFVLLRSSASTPILQCRNRLSSSCAISVDGRYTFKCVCVRQSKVRQ
jgi:hypothetical protein